MQRLEARIKLTVSLQSNLLMQERVRKLYPKGYLESEQKRNKIIGENTRLAAGRHADRLVSMLMDSEEYRRSYCEYLVAHHLLPQRMLLNDLPPEIRYEMEEQIINARKNLQQHES